MSTQKILYSIGMLNEEGFYRHRVGDYICTIKTPLLWRAQKYVKKMLEKDPTLKLAIFEHANPDDPVDYEIIEYHGGKK